MQQSVGRPGMRALLSICSFAFHQHYWRVKCKWGEWKRSLEVHFQNSKRAWVEILHTLLPHNLNEWNEDWHCSKICGRIVNTLPIHIQKDRITISKRELSWGGKGLNSLAQQNKWWARRGILWNIVKSGLTLRGNSGTPEFIWVNETWLHNMWCALVRSPGVSQNLPRGWSKT